jgi:tagatose-6-phosphate ketose/aldose isomerase
MKANYFTIERLRKGLGGKLSEYLYLREKDLISSGAIHTAREIAGQPDLWLKIWRLLQKESGEIEQFLAPILDDDSLNIILTGAGTSAFIGEVLCGYLQRRLNKPVRAVSTTDIVTHPENYFLPQRTTLIVSFARSGNSPESVATVELANQICYNPFHLVITCNNQGEIVRKTSPSNSYIFLLPPEADDKSLAMTGSFTSMALAGLMIWPGLDPNKTDEDVHHLCESGRRILSEYADPVREIANLDFKRGVFLGSGPFFGIAHESHLKLQELSDGKVICKYDSFLGFRHGPKAVIDSSTLNVFIFSNNPYVSKYEIDLVKSVNRGERGIFRMGIMENPVGRLNLDLEIVYGGRSKNLAEPLLGLCSILPAQMLGFYKSLQLGLKPDRPSESGTITRVVQGVNIYPYEKAKSLSPVF